MRPVAISDHALLRFMARGAEMDVEALRVALAVSLERAHRAASSIGATDYLIRADGLLSVVRGDTVTTVLDDKDSVTRAATVARRRV